MAEGRRLAIACLGFLGGLLLAGCAGAPPQIVALEPANNANGVAADAPVTVSFDHAVDHGSVAGRFHISPALPGCEDLRAAFGPVPPSVCRVDWSHDSAAFTLRHGGALFQSGTRYSLILDGGVTDPAQVSNGLDHHWGFSTAGAPTLRSTTPGDGATDVGIDSPVGLSFSTAMSSEATGPAISVSPPVEGTRVVQNSRDPSRLVVVFGVLLNPRTTYAVTVAKGATDAHGAPVENATTLRFTTGTGPSGRDHALVLARRAGQLASAVVLAATSAQTPGDPLPAATVLEAPRCTADHCGRAANGAPLEAYVDAALAPDGRHLAIVARDLAAPVSQDHLDLLDLAGGTTPRRLAGDADHPAWSPDGRVLAFSSGAGVELLTPGDGGSTRLPPGDRLIGRPSWSGDGSVLALPVSAAGGMVRVDLADPLLGIRYPVPGVAMAASQPVLSADGSLLALELAPAGSARGGTWLVRLRTGDAAPRPLGDALRPVAFGDGGALLALQRPTATDPALVRVSVAGGVAGDIDHISTALDGRGVDSLVAGSGGRTLGYVQPDDTGIAQAWVENADGSNTMPLTAFAAGGLEAVAVVLP
ncbi:MAG TPA: Ig-like domain-containing protein [Candidatus Dormibacteraeota bacterium]